MPPNPHHPGHVTTVAIEVEPGWLFFKVTDPKPEPSRIEFFLRRASEDWFAERPTAVIKKTTAITNRGEMLGIHVWYDLADAHGAPVRVFINNHFAGYAGETLQQLTQELGL